MDDIDISQEEMIAGHRGTYVPRKTASEVAKEAEIDVFKVMAEQVDAPPDFKRDLRWAYSSLGNKRAKPDDAPSGAAWHMLEYGRSARSEFMKLAISFFQKEDKEREDEGLLKDDLAKQLRFIEMLRLASDSDLLAVMRERGLLESVND